VLSINVAGCAGRNGWKVDVRDDTYDLRFRDNTIRIWLETDEETFYASVTEPSPRHGSQLEEDIRLSIDDAFEAIEKAQK
jgi:hypothetical protein